MKFQHLSCGLALFIVSNVLIASEDNLNHIINQCIQNRKEYKTIKESQAQLRTGRDISAIIGFVGIPICFVDPVIGFGLTWYGSAIVGINKHKLSDLDKEEKKLDDAMRGFLYGLSKKNRQQVLEETDKSIYYTPYSLSEIK